MATYLNPDIPRSATPPRDPAKKTLDPITPERSKALRRPSPITPSRTPPKLRSEWYDTAHRLLRKMSEENKDNPPYEQDVKDLRSIGSLLIREANPKDQMMFLKLLSDFIVIDSKEIFFQVLKSMREELPSINDLFRDIPSDDPTEGPSLSPYAINMLFQLYEREFGYPEGILKCQSLSNLAQLVNEMFFSSGMPFRGWAIYNDLDPEDPHIVPVFAIQYLDQVHLFIFDSVGHLIAKEGGNSRISESLRFLIQKLKEKDFCERLIVYSYRLKRQNTEIGCATFSVLDLKNLFERHFRNGLNIVDFYRTQRKSLYRIDSFLGEDIDFPIFEMDVLPPEMMKVTQSVTKIESYRKSPPDLSSKIPVFPRYTFDDRILSISQDLSSFDRSIQDVLRITRDGREVNLYVEQKRLGDIVQLIRYFYEGSPVSIQDQTTKVAHKVLFS